MTIRPLLSALLAIVFGTILNFYLARRFPPVAKSRGLAWYENRYAWMDPYLVAAFLLGTVPEMVLYRTVLSSRDPRGAAVGVALACIFTQVALYLCTRTNPELSVRGYVEYEELKTGIRNRVLGYVLWPLFALSLYGSAHLIIYGR